MLKKLKYYDFTLIITPILLTAFGLLMVYSSSMVIAVVEGKESTYYFIKQLQWFSLGIIGFVFFSIFPYKHYQRLIKLIIFLTLCLLIGVLFFGTTINNAKSWFSIGSVSIQPAEFTKLGLILYLASVYSKKQTYINDFNKGVLPPLIVTVIIVSLIILQPDIGTAAIILAIASAIILSSGIRLRHIFLLVSVAVVLIAIAIPQMITDVRVARFTGAYQPFSAPDTDGYHLIQSYLAIGVGGLTGEGLGQSVQKLGYLMEAHTDFIMAIIAEELGFLGVVIVIGMLTIIVIRGLFIARKCDDSFGSLLSIGISTMVGVQATVNLGSISGILPITGVTLPFISYGGSSLLVLLACMGVLNNVAMNVKLREHFQPESKQQSSSLHTVKHRGGIKWLN